MLPTAPSTSFWTRLPRPVIGLAPMDGVTDAPFRFMVARYGRPDVMLTEFTSVVDICRGPDRLLSSLIYHELERPVVAQLYGKDPDVFYQAAHVVCELGFDGLDINMGCPSRNVASSGAGAGLIRRPDLAKAIVEAARQGIADWAAGQTIQEVGVKAARAEVIERMNRDRGASWAPSRRTIPLSIKTRLGYDEVIVEQWVSHLLGLEPAVISLHGRTLEQMYRGQADWNAIARAARLARGTRTLLFGNGDIGDLHEAVRRVRETGVQGVLIGRGALGQPWFFRPNAGARAWVTQDEPDASERLDVHLPLSDRFRAVIEHSRYFEQVMGTELFSSIREHLGWYCKGFPHAAFLRAQMVRASSSQEVEQILARSLSHWSSNVGPVSDVPSPSAACV